MEKINIALGLINISSSLLIIALSIPLLKGKVKMNDYYGVCIAKSYESEENWYTINRYGARLMIAWAGMLFVVGLLAFAVPFENNNLLIVSFAMAPALFVIVRCIQIVKKKKKL